MKRIGVRIGATRRGFGTARRPAASQVPLELLAHDLGGGRIVAREGRERRLQGPFARRLDLSPDGIVVAGSVEPTGVPLEEVPSFFVTRRKTDLIESFRRDPRRSRRELGTPR